MDDLNPPGAPSHRFPARPESVALARRFVRAALDGVAPEVVDTAQLLVSELVTNAVLHACTEVEVSAWSLDGRVCVRVTDHQPGRGLRPQQNHPYSGTGYGLDLVEQLSSRHGVDTGEECKTVWFEIWPAGPVSPPSGWETAMSPSGPTGTVVLIDLPRALYSTSQQHWHTLLRELTLAASAGHRFGVPPEDLVTAHAVNHVISASVTAALEKQPSDADSRSLLLPVTADATLAVLTLRRVLDLAEDAARDERLLTRPALPQSRAFRQWLFDQIVSQLAGGPITAWTMAPRESVSSSSELEPWDPTHVQASRVPTVAADDGNRIVAANRAAAEMLGWQADDLVGRRLTTLIPEHLRKRHMAAFDSLLLTGQHRILGHSVPLPALHRDGRVVPVRLFIETQETTDGRTVFVAQLTPRTTASASSPPTPGRGLHGGLQKPIGLSPPAAPQRDKRTSGAEVGGMSALERLSLLADTADVLSSAPDLDEALQRVGRALTQRLADWCAVDLLDEHGQLDRVCVVPRDPMGLIPASYEGRLPPVSEAARGPLARVLRGAGPLLLTEPAPPSQAESPLDARHLELFEQLGGSSAVVAPLRARRKLFGALTVTRISGGLPFTEEDLSLVDGLVRSIAMGVDSARLYHETRNIAERLQHTLLPVLPDIEHLQLAARYVPSSTTAEVGGDWYDCFSLPSGETALVIGDVTGHDLDAAVTMSQLRSMLRGIAIDRQEPPGEVLRRLDMANHSLFREATATCIYAVIKNPRAGSWKLEHSSAGHLPPLLTTEEGDTHYLEEGAGLLLGMDPELPRPEARDRLPAGSTVLLYTDGLIEHRGESLDHGMALLRRHTAALAREPLNVFCDELLIRLGADNADDIAILAVRPTPPSPATAGPVCRDAQGVSRRGGT
ncbi:SpoIIE family protein phosphatase [Streptomyces sp. NPDC051322]|uniref:SpoIIE family protein phosphatase n=1 Tax=Streptomyces sp. NPDC051322 TaxID=3154645 RepID=UPI00344F9B0F